MPKAKTAAVSTTEQAVRDLLEEVGCVSDIGVNDTFESLGMDYLDQVEFWMEVEEKLLGGVELNEEDIQKIESVQQIIAFIDRRRNNGKDSQ